MGPRQAAVTQANSAARMSGQDTESPRHAALPSERATNPEDENSRLTDLVMNLEEMVSSLETEITVLNSELKECRQVVQEMASAFGGGGIAEMRCEMEQMSIEIGLLQRAAYGGARDVKEVENFLFDMEQYFLIANVEDEARKVSTATMYLTGDAKLWWRTKYAEIQANQAGIAEARAYRFHARLCENLLGADAGYPRHRQRVIDLGSALAAAERLIDFNPENQRDRQTTPSPTLNKPVGVRSFRSNSNRGGGKVDSATPDGMTALALTGSHIEEEAQPRNPRKKGLMFVDLKIHGKPVRAMIDTGATHNHLESAEVERLRLVLEKGVRRVKAVNSAAQPIAGVAKSMLIKVGPF
ncbi:UNVERIFIED_CONTAM: hypothetical protein Sangu_2665300 [Sesamum angustifolium]|uniref:Retrotransposon gag domain-containing protein n=1 Tax=Sesamum angustifolium TaxID=2727405 RepID=A0AAW2J2H8_9LAMI